jgi:O-antigen/teichoic acid export membrane protein
MSSFRTVSIVSLAFFLQTTFSIIFFLVIARTLPVTEVGGISLFLSFGSIFVVAFSLNLDVGLTHFISFFKGELGEYFLPRMFIVLPAVLTVTSFTFIVALSSIISDVFFHSSQYKTVVILLGVYVAESISIGFLVSILQGIQSFKLAAISNIIYSGLTFGLPTIMSFFKLSIEFIAMSFSIGAGISLIITLFFVLMTDLSRKTPENDLNRKILAYVTPVFLGSLFTTLMGTVDRIILPALTNLTLTAIYTYSLAIATIVTALTSPFSFFLLPKISENFGSSQKGKLKKYTQGSLEMFYFIALPASIGAALLSRPLLSVLVGGVYANNFLILQIMVFSYSFFSFRPIVSSILLGVKRTDIYFFSAVAAFIANVLISLLLIPPFGLYGAVSASISAWALSTVPRIIAVNSIFPSKLPLHPYIRMWFNVIVMAIAVFFTSEFFHSDFYALIFSIVIGLIVYMMCSIINRPFTSEARCLIYSIVTKNHPFMEKLTKLFVGSEILDDEESNST